MTTPGLSDTDLKVLRHYAKTANRELYWNYLAQLPGNDGYGRLALGVVRNDNMPGATANTYAANYAKEHNGRTLTEREWDHFGADLVIKDLAAREMHMANGSRTLALNLPAHNVQDAHDFAFAEVNVDPNAWTPRKLLEAARTHGEPEAEKVWTSMLNNEALGFYRGKDTLIQLATHEGMPAAERAVYARDMARAYGSAIDQRPNDNPSVIGTADHYYLRDQRGDWAEMQHASPTIGVQLDHMSDVNDPRLRAQLEDTYDLRIERSEARKAFHPDDPGQITPSPHPLADSRPRVSLPQPGDDPLYAALRRQLPFEVSNDKVAEVALQARDIGMRHPRQLGGVGIRGDHIICEAIHCGPSIEIDRHTQAPPMEKSLGEAQQLDQQHIDNQVQTQLAMQQSAPGHTM